MRYVSNSVISFSIRLEGRSESARVSFTARSTGGSTFSTDCEALIKALEKSPMYGKAYKRAPECVNEVVGKKRAAKAEAKLKAKEIKGIIGWQDAAEYLIENYGCNAGKFVTPDEILKEAAARNIVFVDLK